MLETMADHVLLGMDETDGGTSMGSDNLLDEDTQSFTCDDDLGPPGILKNIFDDRPLEDSSPPRSPPRRLSGDLLLSGGSSPMRNDIQEEEWRDDARDLPHRKEILLQV
jgi:hypothetical protein